MMLRKIQPSSNCSITELAVGSGHIRAAHSLNDSNECSFQTSSCSNERSSRDLQRRVTSSCCSNLSIKSSSVAKRDRNSSVSPLVPQRRLSNSSDCMTMDKLRVASLSLYEREEQLDILRKSLENLSKGLVQRHLILISGDSGSGKTALSNTVRDPATKLNGLFVGGKFDFENRHEPYSGVAKACAEICGRILSIQFEDTNLFWRIIENIRKNLRSELPLLIKIIPVLMELGGLCGGISSVSVGDSTSADMKNRVNFAFQRFLRIISFEFGLLVLVLDDLQWADGSSVALLEAFLLDSGNRNLMIVGTYRSNEVGETHILHHAINGLKAKREAGVFEITQISVGNLSVEAIDKIIATLLYMDNDAETMGLAQVCFKKTQGNPFFILQYLHMLRNIGLLQFNYGMLMWIWNYSEIDMSTSVTDNVVDLVTAKMALLPQHILGILKIAACLGCSFNQACLEQIWEASSCELSEELDKSQALASALEFLVQEGYISRHCNASSLTSAQTFSWTHDKIQEAALSLVPMSERALFKFEAGDILLSRLSAADLEAAIFIVANLLDAGEDLLLPNDERRLKIARLYCDASAKALSMSAFESVAEFSAKGIKFLPENRWLDHYELSLELYSIAAEAEGCLGNTDVMEQYCDAVLSQKERPMRDKLRVYRALVDNMMVRGLLGLAANLLFNVLEMCNCRFPKNFVLVRATIIAALFKMKSTLKSCNPENLCEMKNPMISDLMKLLDKLITCLYLVKDPRCVLVVHRSLEWTLGYGYCDFSPVAFAATGVILTGKLHDFCGGAWYGEQAIKLLEETKSLATHSRTMFLVYTRILSWTKPLTALLEPMHQSYNVGLKSGDTYSAIWSICNWVVFRYIIGIPLRHLEDDLLLFSKQMEDLKLEIQLLYTNFFRQLVLNLMSYNHSNPLEVIGEIFTREDYWRCSEDIHLSAALQPWQGALLSYFGDHIGQADFVMQQGHGYLQKKLPGSPYIAFDTYLKGISCFAAARETGKQKYAKMGEKLRSKIKKWHHLGNPNVTHYMSFLDAESAALNNKTHDAIKHYQRTISLAGRTGFLHDVALAYERLSEFYLTVKGDKNEATYQMLQCLKYWSDWGAAAKVKALEQKYSHLFPTTYSKVGVSVTNELV